MEPDSTVPSAGSPTTSETRRSGIGVCLSGGGFRATLFHLGAIQRLVELGVAVRPDFGTIASVSGGSVTAAQWAVAVTQATIEHRSIDFGRDISRPLQALAARDIRTGAMAKKYLLPWNWFRGAFVIDAMVSEFENVFGKGTLNLLAERPRFVFCGTDMAFGANFVFERERVGSYLAGYAPSSLFSLAQAVAASACFPPLFGPLRLDKATEHFKGGRAVGMNAEERRKVLEDLRVTDGGVYDNMGLEPVWKDCRVVLVCDAGGLMDAQADQSWLWRIKRYQEIQENQSRALRKRFLLSGYCQGTLTGAYLGIASSTEKYAGARQHGYSKAFAMDVIRNIRTDFDAFSEVERAVLVNHGYALLDAAVRTHVADLPTVDAPFVLPFPEFAAPAMDEGELRRRLVGSEKRKTFGRSA